MIHPTLREFHADVRMIELCLDSIIIHGSIFFCFHPTDHPMNHPRIILMISEPDQDMTIILVSS